MSPVSTNKIVRHDRAPALDGMRGLAVVAVVCLHLHRLRGGHIGVDIFLVLSGFLITSLLLNEIDQTGKFDSSLFYYKRCVRLLPPLLICLGLAVAMAYFEGAASKSYADAIASITYTSNYWRGGDRYLWHTWSLSLEVQFYLVWPFVVVTLSRQNQHFKYATLVIILVGVFFWRLYLLHSNDGDWAIDRTYSGLDTRCDTFVAGATLAFALQDGFIFRSRLTSYILLAFLIAAIFVIRPGNYWMHSVGFSFLAIAIAYIVGYIMCQQHSTFSKAFSLPPLVYFGNISYGLYLYHFPIMQFLEKDFHSSLILGALVSVIAAGASWHFIERPLINRKPARFSAVIEPMR